MAEMGTLRSRIANGKQAEIDAEIERFDRRTEKPAKDPNAWIPPWRRRMLGLVEGVEPGLPVQDRTGDVTL